MKSTDDDHDTHEDYIDRQDDEMPPVEAWVDACEGAIRAVEMVSFEEQGKTAIEQAWKLLWLARKLAGIENELERFTTAQVEFLRHVGVRVEPHTNGDGTQNQAVFNERASVLEMALKDARHRVEDALDSLRGVE